MCLFYDVYTDLSIVTVVLLFLLPIYLLIFMSIFYFSLFSLFCVYFSDVYTVLSVVPVVLSFCAVAELYADTSLTVYCCV